MGSAVQYCIRHNLVRPPSFLETNLQYEVIMGSRAYGVADPTSSDYDIYGFAIPPKHYIFPHLAGYVLEFDTNYPQFNQWEQSHVIDESSGKDFDFRIYNIVRYFRLCFDNNPNMIDSLFVPEFCIKHITPAGQLIRDNRKLFLSKRCWTKFRGYAASQFHKIENKQPTGARKELVEKYGYDIKFAYHIIRLLREAEQILTEGDLQLDQSNDELKAIRAGEWSYDRLCKEFEVRKLAMEEIISKSPLREEPDRDKIRELLLECLELHYGKLGNDAIVIPTIVSDVFNNIQKELNRLQGVI